MKLLIWTTWFACSESYVKEDTDLLPDAVDSAEQTDTADTNDTGDTSDTEDTSDTSDTEDTEDTSDDDYYTDDDGDGFSESDGDCDDADANVNPEESETPYNGINDDCDSATPDDDLDSDGFDDADDCDDSDATINPDMSDDSCNGIDNNCDGNIDEGWTTEIYEPNDFSPYDLGELLENQTIDVQAYMTPEGDVDQYSFYNDDGWWDSFGFDVYTANVAPNVDIAISIDYVGSDGIQVNVLSEVNDFGPGQNEYVDYNGSIGPDDSGTYIVKVRSVSGSDCGLMYTLFMEDP